MLTTMVIHLGFPEYLNETRAIEHKFEIGRNLMQNLMMIKKARQEELLVDFEKRFFVTNKRWPQVPLTVGDFSVKIDGGVESSTLICRSLSLLAVTMTYFVIYRVPRAIMTKISTF